MRSWLTALRIARREARRSRGRSVLVVALIGLPVLAFAYVAVTYDTFQLTPAEKADRTIGRADVLVAELYDGPVRQYPTDQAVFSQASPNFGATADDVRAVLPAGSRVIARHREQTTFRTTGGRGEIGTLEFDYADPIAAGLLRQRGGRAPDGPDEVAVSPAAATRIGTGIGGTLTTPDGSRSWRVVGLVADPESLTGEIVVGLPGALPRRGPTSGDTDWLADTPSPLSWPDVVALNAKGVVALSHAVLADPPAYDPATMPPRSQDGNGFALGTVLGGALVLEVVLLAGPAFAVGARRRRRDLALVAAAGGSPAHLRRIVLADGVVLGGLAAVVGLVLGVAAGLAGIGIIRDRVVHAEPGAMRVFPAALAGLAAIAVAAGLLAALVPAWTAARQPVVAGLSGRYAATRVRRRWAIVGVVVLAAGVAVTVFGARQASDTLAVTGMVLGEIGLVLCTPMLVGLIARLGGLLPPATRIALRDVGRNRAAAAPAISAVLAAVAVSTLAGAVLAGSNERYRAGDAPATSTDGYVSAQVQQYSNGPDDSPPPDPQPQAFPALAAAMRATMPVTDAVPVGRLACPESVGVDPGRPTCDVSTERPAATTCPYSFADHLSTAQQRKARRDPRCGNEIRTGYGSSFFTVVIEPADLRRLIVLDAATIAAGEAVLRDGGALAADTLAVADGKVQLVKFDADGVRTGYAVPALALPKVDSPVLVLSPATAARLGLSVKPAGFVGVTDRTPTRAEEDAFLDAAAAVDGSWTIGVQRPPVSEIDLTLVLLAVVSGVVTIAAAAIATGLAAAETRADLATLGAVGASPAVRRALSLSRTGIIAGLGSVLGLAAGLGATAALVGGINAGLADVWPEVQPPMPFIVPWPNIVISLVVVPVVAMLGAGLFTRSRLPIERHT